MLKNIKNIYFLLIIFTILLITNITMNLISNEKYSDFKTKPDFYYKYNNFKEYDLYDKLVNYNNFFKRIDNEEIGEKKRYLNNKIDYIGLKTGSGDKSINESIIDFSNRKEKLQILEECINEGKDCY